MEMFNAYSHALASLGGFSILVIVLSILTVIGRSNENTTQSGLPKRDHQNPVYRRYRAQQNALETAPAFVAAVLGAVMTGANPFLVNLLASTFLVARILTAVIHISKDYHPMRTVTWLVAMICALALGILAIWGAFS